ncbi:hypothetical protein [Beduinella massiliensis]|uniref:hypothetical protein n=1 Tax=Beduinella massiliensis TaxID=1852363 RepID=UPI0011AF1F57
MKKLSVMVLIVMTILSCLLTSGYADEPSFSGTNVGYTESSWIKSGAFTKGSSSGFRIYFETITGHAVGRVVRDYNNYGSSLYVYDSSYQSKTTSEKPFRDEVTSSENLWWRMRKNDSYKNDTLNLKGTVKL